MSSNSEQFIDSFGSKNKGDDSDLGFRPGEDIDDADTEFDNIKGKEDADSLDEFYTDDYVDHSLSRGDYTPEVTESDIHSKSNETSFIPDPKILEAFDKVNRDLETSSPENTATLCVRHGISLEVYSLYSNIDGKTELQPRAAVQTKAAQEAINEAVDEEASLTAMERVMREHGIK